MSEELPPFLSPFLLLLLLLLLLALSETLLALKLPPCASRPPRCQLALCSWCCCLRRL